MRSAWLVIAVLASCGGGDDGGRPPAAPDPQGGSSSGGSKAQAGSSSKPTAGAAGEGEEGGSPSGEGGAGGGIVYETAGAPMFEPGLCDPEMAPGADEAQDVGVSGAKLLAMTPDERTVAFTTGSGDTLTLYVADRTTTSNAFSEQVVTLPTGYEAASGAALSGDGLSLVLVRSDHDGFGELSRASRSAAFGGDADESRFASLNGLKSTTGRALGWPVLSSDGADLYYLSYFGQGLVMQATAAQGGVFAYGQELDMFILAGPEGEYLLPTGIAADQRALFLFEQATGHSTALFRSRPGGPFYTPVDLGEREGVSPSEDCSRIYSSVAGDVVHQATE